MHRQAYMLRQSYLLGQSRTLRQSHMLRHGVEAVAATLMLVLAAAASASSAEAAGMKRTVTMVAVEPKGGATVDKEPFPTAALPQGKGMCSSSPTPAGAGKSRPIAGNPARSS